MLRRPRAALHGWLAPVAAVPLVRPVAALADHGGPLRDAPMSPLAVALTAGGLALAVGLVVVALVSLLAGKRDGPDDDA